MQEQLGVDQPDFGVLLRRHGRHPTAPTVPIGAAAAAEGRGRDRVRARRRPRRRRPRRRAGPRRGRATPSPRWRSSTAASPAGTSPSPTPSPTTRSSGALRARRRAGDRSTSSSPVDVEMTHDASTARSSPPATAPPASATRSTRWPGWPAPPATSASRCAPGRSCCPARSARWSPVAAGDTVRADDHRPRLGHRHASPGRRRRMSTRPRSPIIGSGNIGTDLMIKVLRLSDTLEMGAMVGIDPDSDGLARAARLGVADHRRGRRRADRAWPSFDEIEIVFDATSAKAHAANAAALAPYGKRLIDLTPAAIGPYVVPAVNLDEHLDAAERQHGHLRRPGHHPDRRGDLAGRPRCRTPRSSPRSPRSRPGPAPAPTSTSSPRPPSHAIETVGGAARGKAIIILNPAEPPLIMRDTVFAWSTTRRRRRTTRSARRSSEMVAEVADVRARATGSSRQVQITPDARRPARAHARRRRAGHPPGVGVPRGRGRRPLPARPTPATSTS